MNEQLRNKRDEYLESLQSLREEGQALRRLCEREGWHIIHYLSEVGGPCAISPELWTVLTEQKTTSL